MNNRLYDCICVFILLAILQSSICHAKVINDTRRTKREISIAETSQSIGGTSYGKEINLEHDETGDDDPEGDDAYRDNTKEKRKVSRKASVVSVDLHPSNSDGSFDRDDVSSYLNSQHSSEEPEEVDEESAERDKNKEGSNLVRLPRETDGDLDRYTDQERSSLYDDYEAKDVAKRGVLSGPEDYEEVEDDSAGMSEDVAAVRESMSEVKKREVRKDARVKRDQVEISEMPDMSKSSPDNPAQLEESSVAAKIPYSRQVSRIESSKGFNEASASNDTPKMKGSRSMGVISKLSDSSKFRESMGKVTSSKNDESNAEYEKRVEEEIQRKIDSLKEEIQRDIEAQQRIRDIEDNNARFDELQDQEHEDEERRNFKDEPIEKRQAVAKRSVREIADDTAGSPKKNEKKRSLRRELRKKQPHRSSKIDKGTSKENEDLKKRFVANRDKSSQQIPSKGLLKKKRERVRQVFLENNDQHQAKKRQSRSYTVPSCDRIAIGPEKELFMSPDSNSYHTNTRMLQEPLPVDGEDENNEGEQNPTMEHSDSLVSLTGSSRELSPRLEKEYKEAFGGLQSEPGSALARFKRIKRGLAGTTAKI